jgi:protein-L-isoaspartate(D-aspartate) O-methyltransferase
VVAVEEDEAMATEAPALLSAIGADNVIVQPGPLTGGAGEHGPYDAILIQGAIEVLPDALADQLKEGGRIACLFVEGTSGTEYGTIRIGLKHRGVLSWRFDSNAAAPILPGFEKPRVFAL